MRGSSVAVKSSPAASFLTTTPTTPQPPTFHHVCWRAEEDQTESTDQERQGDDDQRRRLVSGGAGHHPSRGCEARTAQPKQDGFARHAQHEVGHPIPQQSSLVLSLPQESQKRARPHHSNRLVRQGGASSVLQACAHHHPQDRSTLTHVVRSLPRQDRGGDQVLPAHRRMHLLVQVSRLDRACHGVRLCRGVG